MILERARAGDDLDAVVTFHGMLERDPGRAGQDEGTDSRAHRRGRSVRARRPGRGVQEGDDGRGRGTQSDQLPGGRARIHEPVCRPSGHDAARVQPRRRQEVLGGDAEAVQGSLALGSV